ncbi:hypothetical protein BH10ACT1_BH10ACT1_30030 [soil metagenome]
MGWNLSVVQAQGPAATVEGFALVNGYRPEPNDLLASVEETVLGGDVEADARPRLAVTETGAGLLLVARLILNHSWAAGLSERKGSATWAVWQGTSDSYAFAHYRDGALVRELARHEGEATLDFGAPLVPEASLRWNDPDAAPDDEQDLFDLVQRVTNLPEASHWLAAPARLYAPGAITEIALAKKKRRLFRR